MPQRSFKLFHRKGRSYLARLTFPDGRTAEIDTKELTEKKAASRARWVLRHRLAKRRHYQREKLQKLGKPVPVELARKRPGRRRETVEESEAPAPASSIDATETAQKLAALAADGLADEDVPPDASQPVAGAPAPSLGEGDGEGAPAAPPKDIPPLPEPVIPEVMPPRTGPSDGELMSEMISTALCAGTIRGMRWMGENSVPPWRPAEPHAGSLDWLQKGLAGKIRLYLGDRIVSDGTKAIVGFIGVVASMAIGAQPMYGHPGQQPPPAPGPDHDHDNRPSPPPPPPPRPPTTPPPPPPPRQLASKNGVATAVGRF